MVTMTSGISLRFIWISRVWGLCTGDDGRESSHDHIRLLRYLHHLYDDRQHKKAARVQQG